TEVGKERGSWKSFNTVVEANTVMHQDENKKINGNKATVYEGEDLQAIDIKPATKTDDFEGGAFSKIKLDKITDKMKSKDKSKGQVKEDEYVSNYAHMPIDEEYEPLSTSETGEMPLAQASAVASMNNEEIRAQAVAETFDHGAELEESIVRKFRSGTINKEVWFVALGAETRNAEGMRHFLEAHKNELRGAVYIQIESLSAGNLAYVGKDGYIKNTKISGRLLRLAEKTARRIGVPIKKVNLNYGESSSSVVQSKHLQALRIVGELNSKPAFYSDENDTLDYVDNELLEERAAYVLEMIRSI
ncbi:MAG: hypothetical protein HUJ51_02520, partial [Eggerthellaceae bacterium]|nr:hypothetical protein [Eggerthellaceae bacterium]